MSDTTLTDIEILRRRMDLLRREMRESLANKARTMTMPAAQDVERYACPEHPRTAYLQLTTEDDDGMVFSTRKWCLLCIDEMFDAAGVREAKPISPTKVSRKRSS